MAAQSERIIIGDIGGASVPESAPINAGVVAEDAFRTPAEFASIALRTLSDGSSVKLGDVARVEPVSYTHLDVYKRQPLG